MCSADDPGFSLPDVREDWQTLLLDDLQLMLEPEDQEDLAALIRENPRRRFVLLTRGVVPSWLIPFQIAGVMAVFDAKDLALDREARSRLAWLDIALPQRTVDSMIDTFRRLFVLLTNREIRLPSFSVTSTLPSLMNGGKDFSPWSKKDDLLYATLRVPVELALGRDGVCLADCAIAESKFEKGEAKTVARQLHLI